MSTNNNGISVYQSLDQNEKVKNYSSNPELVYSSITTLSNIIRQVEKEGIGIVFCHNNSSIQTIQKHLDKKYLTVVDLHDLKGHLNHFVASSKVIAVALSSSDIIKISELQSLAKHMKSSGVILKWISILKQPSFHQLIKWELK
jgi:hypothetical protein